MTVRDETWDRLQGRTFDAVIIGAGINGASIFRALSARGGRVLLLDKSDFSCGTSQASAMMIWGGLLYLKDLKVPTVRALSRDRDALIRDNAERIRPQECRYVISRGSGRSRSAVLSALYLYWVLGLFHRRRPAYQRYFAEQSFLRRDSDRGSVIYEEGVLNSSDSRFILDWIIAARSEHSLALNYCEPLACSYQGTDRLWTVFLSDVLSGKQCAVRTGCIINCAGVWTDRVNEQFGIISPYRHALSKGVFIGFERPADHRSHVMFEMGQHGDMIAFIPWGPISLWGPTETMVHSPESGFRIDGSDVGFLVEHAHRNLEPLIAGSRIVSLRCGVRPLAVRKGFKADCYPLELSRGARIVPDRHAPWISVYGGKMSGCLSLAGAVADRVVLKSRRGRAGPFPPGPPQEVPQSRFPGLEQPVPSMAWCVQNEYCCTLADYLRRRTNIAQWVPREGLGFHDENVSHMAGLCAFLPSVNADDALRAHLQHYMHQVTNGFDRLTGSYNAGKGASHETA